MRVKLGFIKVEISVPELRNTVEAFKENRLKALEVFSENIKDSVADSLNQLLNLEMTLFLGQNEQIANKRNGYKIKDYTFKGLGTVRINVPVDRHRQFESAVIPKRESVDPRIKEDIAALHLAGLSTRTLSMMSKRLLGLEVSHQTVANSLPMLSGHALNWLNRPIAGNWWALIVDGTNFKVTRRGSTEKEPLLVVLGIDENNNRSILAVESGYRDSADAWRSVFRSLKNRGLNGSRVQVGVMDGLPGLESVFADEFHNSVTARCWFHAKQNAMLKCPKRLRDSFEVLLKKVNYADSEASARAAFADLETKFGHDCQKAVHCIGKDLDSLLNHYRFPKGVWQALKTTNAVERIHKEFKRRSRAMEGMSEMTLMTLVAFTALRLEMGWRRRAVDTYEVDHLVHDKKRRELPDLKDVIEGKTLVH
jgi:putative transposase